MSPVAGNWLDRAMGPGDDEDMRGVVLAGLSFVQQSLAQFAALDGERT